MASGKVTFIPILVSGKFKGQKYEVIKKFLIKSDFFTILKVNLKLKATQIMKI